jgi:hypothetical protein
MNAFSRSWEVTKLSFSIMRADKELFLFPLLGALFSFLFFLAMVVPTILASFLAGNGVVGLLFWVVLFFLYLGLALIATFFNVCVVYTVKTRLEGKNATFGESIKFAFSRFGLILAWSLVSATVGLILHAIDSLAERMGGIGEIIVKILSSLLGAAWAIITVFVVPGMVYKNIGPFAAIKDSVVTLKKTWGEALIQYVGLGLVEFLALLALVVIAIPLAIVALIVAGIWGLLSVVFLACLCLVTVILFFAVAKTVFNTALYAYATTGKTAEGFNEELLKSAFQSKPTR